MTRRYAIELVHDHEEGRAHNYWLEVNGQKVGILQLPNEQEPSLGQALALLLSVPYRQLV